MLFSGSPEGRYTLVPSFLEGTEITSVGFAFHEAKASCFRTTASPQASVYHVLLCTTRVGRGVGQLKTRGDKSVHEGEQVSLKEFPG